MIYAMIPARMGSERLKRKNLLKIQGQELVRLAIKKAKKIRIFDEVYVNSESRIIGVIANQEGANFYLRPDKLASSETPSDAVVNDFFLNHRDCDILVWINTVSPLQSIEEIESAIEYFIKNKLDSLITSYLFYRHANFENKPLNYEPENIFARTQDLIPIEVFSYSTMIFRRETFLKHYRNNGQAFIFGNFSTFPVSLSTFLAIKNSEDYEMISTLYNAKRL